MSRISGSAETTQVKNSRGFLGTFATKIGHPVVRCLLPTAVMLVGGVIVLASEIIARQASSIDAALAAHLIQILPPKGDHTANKLFTEHFFAEVGIAFIVAGLTALFVELLFRAREVREHERRTREIETSVFTSLLGMFAPPWLSTKVIDLYKARLLRTNLKLTFTFAPSPDLIEPLDKHRLPSREELLMMTVQIGYHLTNLSDELVPCEVEHGFTPTVPIAHEHSGFTGLSISRQNDRPLVKDPQTLTWQKGENKSHVHCPSPSSNDPESWKRREIVIKDLLIHPKETVEVSVSYDCVRWRYDHADWGTRIPADQLEVTAIVKDDLQNLRFLLSRSHPNDFKPTGINQWQSDGPVLPYQGFSLHWFLAPANTTQQAPHADVEKMPINSTEPLAYFEIPEGFYKIQANQLLDRARAALEATKYSSAEELGVQAAATAENYHLMYNEHALEGFVIAAEATAQQKESARFDQHFQSAQHLISNTNTMLAGRLYEARGHRYNDSNEFREAAEAYWEAGRIYKVLSEKAIDPAEKRLLEDRVGYMNHAGNTAYNQID